MLSKLQTKLDNSVLESMVGYMEDDELDFEMAIEAVIDSRLSDKDIKAILASDDDDDTEGKDDDVLGEASNIALSIEDAVEAMFKSTTDKSCAPALEDDEPEDDGDDDPGEAEKPTEDNDDLGKEEDEPEDEDDEALEGMSIDELLKSML